MFVCLCVSASISLEPLDFTNFLCRSSVAVARSSSGGVAIRCVLPVFMDDVTFGHSAPYGDALRYRRGV